MSWELHDRPRAAEVEARAIAILEAVGLAEQINYHPQNLSGGQKQRVAERSTQCKALPVVFDDDNNMQSGLHLAH